MVEMSVSMESTEHLTTLSLQKDLSSHRTSRQAEAVANRLQLSMARTAFLVSTLNATVLVGAMNTGMMTVALPQMTIDLDISQSLQLWFVFSPKPY